MASVRQLQQQQRSYIGLAAKQPFWAYPTSRHATHAHSSRPMNCTHLSTSTYTLQGAHNSAVVVAPAALSVQCCGYLPKTYAVKAMSCMHCKAADTRPPSHTPQQGGTNKTTQPGGCCTRCLNMCGTPLRTPGLEPTYKADPNGHRKAQQSEHKRAAPQHRASTPPKLEAHSHHAHSNNSSNTPAPRPQPVATTLCCIIRTARTRSSQPTQQLP